MKNHIWFQSGLFRFRSQLFGSRWTTSSVAANFKMLCSNHSDEHMLYVQTCQISRPSTWILFCGRGEADLEIRTDDARILHWCGLRARRQCRSFMLNVLPQTRREVLVKPSNKIKRTNTSWSRSQSDVMLSGLDTAECSAENCCWLDQADLCKRLRSMVKLYKCKSRWWEHDT